MVFISFSNIFIEGGLTTALIQKNNRTDLDFYTAFVYNIVVAFFFYILLFISSPYIADFYNQPQITWLLRVLGLNLLISCFSSIQITRLTIDVNFKPISITSVLSGFISGIIGIVCAVYGMGVWALVIQQIVCSLIRSFILSIFTRWGPRLLFSNISFKYLFSFGSKLILANILDKIYMNLYPLIIGKLYPAKSLGFYTRANQYSTLAIGVLNDVFMRVSFPILSSIKDDDERLKKMYRLYIEISSFIIFPLMFMLIIIAKPLIFTMLTEKWMPCAPYLMILTLGYMFAHISAINLNLLYVKGRSDLALKLEFLKKSIAISILIVSCFWGLYGICIGQAIYGVISTFLNSFYTKKLINLNTLSQLHDFGIVWIISAVSALIAYIFIQMIGNCYLQVLIGILSYLTLYILICKVFKLNAYSYFILTMKELRQPKKL